MGKDSPFESVYQRVAGLFITAAEALKAQEQVLVM